MSDSIALHLRRASQQLRVVTDVPQLEAEILLAYSLKQSRTYLLARSNDSLSLQTETFFLEMIQRRLQGEPIAYLVGRKEFWSLDLKITSDVLIPRPETELLVELVLNKTHNTKIRLADLGTGSGAIALAIAHERPSWEIYATDQSAAALKIAQHNANQLHIQNITFLQGEWCEPLISTFDIIVSNPPYLAENDPHLQEGDLRFEPKAALISSKNGLNDLFKIILSSYPYLKDKGCLWVEHGYQQGELVRKYFANIGYTAIETYRDVAGLERATCGYVINC